MNRDLDRKWMGGIWGHGLDVSAQGFGWEVDEWGFGWVVIWMRNG